MKQKTEGWLEVVAAAVVLFMSGTDKAAAVSLAVVMLLVMGVWRLSGRR